MKGKKTQEYITDIDITKWLPGEHTETIEIPVSTDMPTGTYELQIAIGGGNKPSVQFANELEADDGFYALATVNVIRRENFHG